MQKKGHSFQASHPRFHHRATKNSSDRLLCVVQEYTRDGDDNERNGTFNIILAHANGFVKELYEPFIASIFKTSNNVKAVFAADVVSQGHSGRVNADKLGDRYSWTDSARDLLVMVDRLDIAKPIVGIGHSMGACQVLYASLLHPTLFEAIVAIDPVVFSVPQHVSYGAEIALLSSRRRDRWPSRQEAREAFGKSAFYRDWDPAVFDLWIQHGLSAQTDGSVTLTTTVAQEVYSFMHFMAHTEREPDCGTFVASRLHEIAVPVKYLFGQDSVTCSLEKREDLHRKTQASVRVDVPSVGHLVPMVKVKECAAECVIFINTLEMKTRERMSREEGETREDRLSENYIQSLKELKQSKI